MTTPIDEILNHILWVDPYDGGAIEQANAKIEKLEKLLRCVVRALPDDRINWICDEASRS